MEQEKEKKSEYISGVFRGDGGDKMVTHLYYGPYGGPMLPMCSRGWQRKYFDKDGKIVDWEFSIFRNNHSEGGMCEVCRRRMMSDLPPIKRPSSRTKYNPNNPNHFQSKV